MDPLKDSIQKSKEERMKKLEALRKAKQDREDARRVGSTFVNPSMREDMNHSYNSDLSLNISAELPNLISAIMVVKSEIGIKNTGNVSVNPKPKPMMYESEIQVEIETDSEDEEKVESMKGVRNTAMERMVKVEVKEDEPVEVVKTKEIDPDEAEIIIATSQFGEFFSRCAIVMEKALDEKFDVVEDFILQQKTEDPFDQKGKIKLVQLLHYTEEDRCISSLTWSPNHNDMVMAAYIKSDLSECKAAQGIINIWHLEDPTKPKHTLSSQSSITNAQFYPNDHNIVMGGSYTGQLLIWDLRAKSLPIQRSPALSKGHSFPIVGLSFAESRHSSNAVSLSSDGKFCVWMMSLLQNPIDTYGK